jgi:hypothetical protein
MLDTSSSVQAGAWRAVVFDSSLCTWLVLPPLLCLPQPSLLYITLTWVSCGLLCASLQVEDFSEFGKGKKLGARNRRVYPL